MLGIDFQKGYIDKKFAKMNRTYFRLKLKRISFIFILLVALHQSFNTFAQSGVCFSPINDYYNFVPGTSPSSVTSADFNHDGKADLATANSGDNNVSVFLGNGSGGFSPAVNFAVHVLPSSITSADFNGDGKVDLAVANTQTADVSVLLGNGSGSFSNAVNFAVGSQPFSVTSADFNNDSNADIVVANYNTTGTLSVLLGNGAGSFSAAVSFAVGTYPRTVRSADFNKDGKADLVCSNYGSNNVSVLLGDGLGGFAAAVNFAVGANPTELTTADLNGDGKTDLAMANYGSASNDVYAYLGDGSGGFSFASVVYFPTGYNPRSIISADFNGDGKADLATMGSPYSYNVSFLIGNGSGSFASPVSFEVNFNSSTSLNLTSADFNADGIADLATASGSVLLSDGSGSFKGGHLTATTGISIISEDFNKDGNADLAVADLADVRIYFGNGTGRFQAAVFFAVPGYSSALTSADFNGDAKADLATTNYYSGTNQVSVLLGNGSGSFAVAINHNVGTSPVSLISADFNQDGNADLATANDGSNNVSVLLGNGSGGVVSGANFATGSGPSSVTSADFNADGKADLATANVGSNNVSVLLGNGSGSFAAAVNFTTGTTPVSLISADFNQDGKADLAIANYGSNNVSVLLGNGSGSFASANSFATGTNPKTIISADFNGDGKADLAIANYGSNNVSILLGDGSGSFAPAVNFAAGRNSVASGDFNNDGKLDMALTDYYAGDTLTVLLNNAAPTVSLSTFNTVCSNASPFVLTGGTPAAGTYSGVGVSGGNFYPATAGTGTHTIIYSYADANNCFNSASSPISVSVCTGITAGNSLYEELSVYPNPFSSYTVIKAGKGIAFSNTSVYIYNAYGVLVIKRANINADEIKIERENIASGLYFYQAFTNELLIGEGKLVVQD